MAHQLLQLHNTLIVRTKHTHTKYSPSLWFTSSGLNSRSAIAESSLIGGLFCISNGTMRSSSVSVALFLACSRSYNNLLIMVCSRFYGDRPFFMAAAASSSSANSSSLFSTPALLDCWSFWWPGTRQFTFFIRGTTYSLFFSNGLGFWLQEKDYQMKVKN